MRVGASPEYMGQEQIRQALQSILEDRVSSGRIRTQKDLDAFWSTIDKAALALRSVPFKILSKVMTVKEVRELVREVLAEAPLADIHPFQDVSRLGDEYEDVTKEKDKNIQQVKKFHGSSKFRDDAIKSYRFLNVPIHIVPAWNVPTDPGDRIVLVDPTKNLDGLENSLDMDPEVVSKLADLAKRGDAVWIVQSSSLMKGNLPTPWMIVHAMFDDNAYHSGQVYKIFHEELDLAFDLADEIFGADLNFGQVLTMKSARDGNVVSETDVGPEILCQALLTTHGFKYNLTGVATVDDLLVQLDKKLAGVRKKFENVIRGKIMLVDVSRGE